MAGESKLFKHLFPAGKFHNSCIINMYRPHTVGQYKHYTNRCYTQLGYSDRSNRIYSTIQNICCQYMDNCDINIEFKINQRPDCKHELCLASESKLLCRLLRPGKLYYSIIILRLHCSDTISIIKHHNDKCNSKLVTGQWSDKLYNTIQENHHQHMDNHHRCDKQQVHYRIDSGGILCMASKDKLFCLFFTGKLYHNFIFNRMCSSFKSDSDEHHS